MLKLTVKPIILSAALALSLTAGLGRATAEEMNEMESVSASFSDTNSGIVMKQVADEDSNYCHIKYMAFTERSLKSGDLEFNPNDVIDMYGNCAFNPKQAQEVHKQIAFQAKSVTNDGESD